MGLKINDLVHGDIYYNEAFGEKYIFMYNKDGFKHSSDIQYHIYIGTKEAANAFAGGGLFGTNEILKGIRPATYEEALWLRTCINRGRYVPRKFISYEIY